MRCAPPGRCSARVGGRAWRGRPCAAPHVTCHPGSRARTGEDGACIPAVMRMRRAECCRPGGRCWACPAQAWCEGVQCNPLVADTRGVSRAGGHTDPRPPACVQRKRELAAELWSLALVPAAFAAFMVVNGGVVVGDRAHHAPAAHWAQPLYALLFAAAAFAPVHFRPRRRAPLAHARVVGGQSKRHLESHMLCIATWCILALALAPRAWL